MPEAGKIWIDITANLKTLNETVEQLDKALGDINKQIENIGFSIRKTTAAFAASAASMQQAMKRTSREAEKQGMTFRKWITGGIQGATRAFRKFERVTQDWLETGEEAFQVITFSLAAIGGATIYVANEWESNMARIRAAIKGSESDSKKFMEVVQQVYASGIPKSLEDTTNAAIMLYAVFGRLPKTKLNKYLESVALASWMSGQSMTDVLSAALELMNEFKIGLIPALELAAHGFDKDKVEAIGLDNALNRVRGTLNKAKTEAQTDPWRWLREEWTKWQQVLKPLGDRLRQFYEEHLPKLRAEVQKLVNWFLSLNKEQQDMIIWIGILIALLPVLALALGGLGWTIAALVRILLLPLALLRGLIGLFRWLWIIVLWLAGGLRKLLPWLQKAWKAFRNLRLGALLLRAALLLVRHPIGLIVLAILLLIWVIAELIKHWDTLKAKAKRAWEIIKTHAGNAVDYIKRKWSELESYATRKWASIRNRVVKAIESIRKVPASSWGKNLIKDFAMGILSGQPFVFTAVRTISRIVSRFLGHRSPTKEGPGKHSDEWAPNLMSMFAEGIVAGIPKVEMAVNAAAKVVADGLSPTRNTTYNVTVNNNSRPLSSQDIINSLRRRDWLYA